MQSIQLRNKKYAFLYGQISNESYIETIKKLTLVSKSGFAQLVPAKFCAGSNHVAFALEQTLSSFEKSTNIAKSLQFEFLCRFFAETQVNKVLKLAEFGIEQLLLVCELKNLAQVKKLLSFIEKKSVSGNEKEIMQQFGISQMELKTFSALKNPLESLVIERIALVSIGK